MKRTLLILAVLTLRADAAPQLKPKKPAPGTEEARIEALRAKYDQIRKSKSDRPADERARVDLMVAEALLRSILQEIDRRPPMPAAWPGRYEWERRLERDFRADLMLKDLYDIALHDREKAAGTK
jgi:hypothetical protein